MSAFEKLAFGKLTNEQKIRATLRSNVRTISSETCHFLGLEVTKPAMEVIAELICRKLSVYGADLEAFAKHAKRSTIISDDVKLLVRRNPSLLTHLNTIVPAASSTGPRRRKTAGKPQQTPAKSVEESNKDKETVDKENEEKVEEIVSDDTKIQEEKGDNLMENMVVDEIDLTFD